jgi:hypothetical protein
MQLILHQEVILKIQLNRPYMNIKFIIKIYIYI